MEAPLSFKMRNGHVIVLEKVFVICWRKEIQFYGHMAAKDSQYVRYRTTLIKFERCYWITVVIGLFITFSDRESDRQHRTMTFAELPNHPILLTMVYLSWV